MDNLTEEQHVRTGVLKGINFNILCEADAEKMSVKVIGAANEVTDPMLGLPNPTSLCLTCGAKNSRACEGHMGLIRFPFTIINPYFMKEVVKILNLICPGCKSVKQKSKKAESTSLDPQPTTCKYCDRTSKDLYPPIRFGVSSKELCAKTAITAEVKLPKNSSLSRGFAHDFWDFVSCDTQQEETSTTSNKRVFSHAQVYQVLKDVDSSIIKAIVSRKNSIFLQSFLLTPNCHRVIEFGHNIAFDPRTRAYKKLIDFRGSANELSSRALDCLKLSKVRSEKPSVNNYAIANESAPKMTGSKYIKDLLLAKMSNNAIRMVCVGDPFIRLDEIGVPRHIADQMVVSENLNELNYEKMHRCCGLRIFLKGEVYVRRNGNLAKLKFGDYLRTGDAIDRPLRDGDIVLINRPPSIHPHSLLALSVKILPTNSVLSINPLICSPLRGDFDGDSLHIYIPQSFDSQVELHELVAIKNQLTNKQTGQSLLSLSHDSLTAAHMLVEDGVFLNQFQIQQLQMYCSHQLDQPVLIKAPSERSFSSCLWTGKQIFGGLLPQYFSYNTLGIHIAKGQLLASSHGSSWLHDGDDNIFHSLIQHCTPEEVLKFLDSAQEVLLEWLSMRGLSVSLSDLYISPDSHSRKNLSDDVLHGLREAERTRDELLMLDSCERFLDDDLPENSNCKDIGGERMCYEQQKSAALNRASVSSFKQVFRDIQNLIYNYSSKENSFLTMLRAGSKGNLLKFVQHSMCLGQQPSSVPLTFYFPHQLSCSAWNEHKRTDLLGPFDDIPCVEKFIPCAVIENSFLTGLNPLELFVHSVTNRDSSFGGHADISGTLNRKLMFFMRDLYIGYDKTVRNLYGNQLIQFSYNTGESCSPSNSHGGCIVDDVVGGEPVGALAACAISEAAYSALDQPISVLESSPLLNLKKVLECGVKRASGDKTVSLFLSKILKRRTYGLEYGALDVKNHLQRIIFHDIVSVVTIFFSPQSRSSHFSPWVCHFHLKKEVVTRKKLNIRWIIDVLNLNCNSTRNKKSKISLPNLQITCKEFSDDGIQKDISDKICIAVQLIDSSKSSSTQLIILRDMVIPFLLGTVIKGLHDNAGDLSSSSIEEAVSILLLAVNFVLSMSMFNILLSLWDDVGSSNVKKIDILWKDQPNMSTSHRGSGGELYLRVFMSENCNRKTFWNVLMDDCLQIMDLIDWERSHPDDIHDITLAHGIDAAWNHFLSSLNSALLDTGRNILPEHLILIADCLSATGVFLPLSSKGLSDQRKHASVASPFSLACLSKPADCFVKAAKMGVTDNLQGSIDALAWGNVPSLGTGAQFDIIYSGKGHEIQKSENIYSLLASNTSGKQVREKVPNVHTQLPGKILGPPLCTYKDFDSKGSETFKTMLQKSVLMHRILRLDRDLRHILFKYEDINQPLSEEDSQTVLMALYFHPRSKEKLGSGAQEMKIGYHKKYEGSRCFQLVRTDGTIEDFSYHKCVHQALKFISSKRAKGYEERWFEGK